MLFVCYPKCSTCKKAQAWLDAHSLSYQVRDIKTQNPTQEELRLWHQKSGLPLKRFFNTSGQQYRALELKDKLPTLTEEEQFSLLATDGMLAKRPLLVTENRVLVGFKEAEWAAALLGCAYSTGSGSLRRPCIPWSSCKISCGRSFPGPGFLRRKHFM